MDFLLHFTVVILFTMLLNQQHSKSARTERRLLDFRKMAKVFVRYNVKVNVVPYTSIFAFAMGFRGNWDIKPSTIIHPKRKISLLNQFTPYQQFQYHAYLNKQYVSNQSYSQSPNNPYENQYTSSQFPKYQYQINPYQMFSQPDSYYQRAIHSTVKGAFDWHGVNGSACLQRTFCEVSVIHEDDIISQILKLFFNVKEDFDCPEDIQCPISLIQLIDHILTGPHTHSNYG